MKFSIPVDNVPIAGMVVAESLDPEWVDNALGDALKAGEGPFRIELELAREGANVVVDGEVEVDFTFDCSRCAETAAQRTTVPIKLAYAEATGDAEDEAVDIGVWGIAADRELTIYEGPTIELERELIEQIVFALPSVPLCRETCRGLCAECGRDLNEASCACVVETVDPRWAKLKDIKLRG